MECSKPTDELKILDLIRGHTSTSPSSKLFQEASISNSSIDLKTQGNQATATNTNTIDITKPINPLNSNQMLLSRNSTAPGVSSNFTNINGHLSSVQNAAVANLVNTNSLLISSSGALDSSQINSLTQVI